MFEIIKFFLTRLLSCYLNCTIKILWFFIQAYLSCWFRQLSGHFSNIFYFIHQFMKLILLFNRFFFILLVLIWFIFLWFLLISRFIIMIVAHFLTYQWHWLTAFLLFFFFWLFFRKLCYWRKWLKLFRSFGYKYLYFEILQRFILFWRFFNFIFRNKDLNCYIFLLSWLFILPRFYWLFLFYGLSHVNLRSHNSIFPRTFFKRTNSLRHSYRIIALIMSRFSTLIFLLSISSLN